MENTGEAIWKSFSEKGIVLAGIDGPEYQAFFQSLVRVSQTSRAGFRVLDGVEDIQICKLTASDVVRHVLVQRIVAAYDAYEKTRPPEQPRKFIKRNSR